MRDYDEGVFAREFTAHSFSPLAMLWLIQNGQTGVTLTFLNGKKIVELDNPGVAEYFCSITSGFQGFRRNMRTRGAGDNGVEDIGSRHQRRLKTSLLEDFETALGKVCPQDLGQAFELLQSSQAFKTRFLPEMHYRFAQDDKITQSHHAAEAAHSRGCQADRRVSAQCYRMCGDGSKGRGAGWVEGVMCNT